MKRVEQAAKILGVSQDRIRIWAKEGKLSPKLTPGGHRRISESDILKLLIDKQAALLILFKNVTAEIEAIVKQQEGNK